jgi:hypothetical protein
MHIQSMPYNTALKPTRFRYAPAGGLALRYTSNFATSGSPCLVDSHLLSNLFGQVNPFPMS